MMRRVLMYSRHLVGIALRLCIELGYHRSATVARDAESPYAVELRKRFFWCAYSFDRYVLQLKLARSHSNFSKFHVLYLEVAIWDWRLRHRCRGTYTRPTLTNPAYLCQIPLEVDLTCTDNDTLRHLQRIQAAGTAPQPNEGRTTVL